MKQYGMLQAIVMSFYSKKLYRDVAMNWGGFAFLYLLLITALSWVVFTYQAQVALTVFYAKASDAIVAQVPVMTFKDGKLSTPEKRPYIVKEPDSKDVFAVIDTSGKYKSLKDTDHAEVLITETEMITKPKPETTRIDQFPKSMNMVFKPEVVNDYAKKYLNYSWLLIFPVLVLITFIYRIIQSLVYAVIGRIFSAIGGLGVTYGQIFLITMVALTPTIVLCTVLNIFDVEFAHKGLLYFLVAMVYLFYGILANKR